MTTYWKDGKFKPYPERVERVAEAIWNSFANTIDPHVRPLDPWKIAREEPRYGMYPAALAAIRADDPGYELP